MIDFFLENPVLAVAAVTGAMALAVVVYLLASPPPIKVPIERRRPGLPPQPSALEKATATATALVARLMHRKGTPVGATVFELAAVKMRPQDFVFLIIVGSLVGLAAGVLLQGPLLGVALAIVAPILARLWLGMRVSKRQKAFADQLDDTLVLMASNLRAGHSLAQALSSVASEADSPTSDEFWRVVNETRVGRPLTDSLNDTAARMQSDDFSWVSQAIGINREVGGNLAEVLDRVATTIRQRNEVRRLVATLSAEGRLSAMILILLPFVITGFLLITNPGYLAPFTESVIGYGLIVLGVIMLIIGAVWLNNTVKIKF
ncbi:type II secretion system F family protein [Tessaracoccus sp. OS52]|uniref:type II secretion system F family protein n=1 Tax=Tessaracoccus sp. OS52 TaxID=2886691 RepID=UPI001D12D4B3|nr:type II secretion system F family protein [Tessaracoccus sp. OS52]MCC2592890.1 type II secretion system F family protein [Tessaracoccus sp. OS52]